MFDHENLIVYQRALEFVKFADTIIEKQKKKVSAHSHLDRASTSVALNISEGNGKYTNKDKCRYFDIARGSSLECASCLDILFIKNKINKVELNEGKGILKEIVAMLIGLIKSKSVRVYEDDGEYGRE